MLSRGHINHKNEILELTNDRRGETTRIGAGESYKPYGSRSRTPLRVDTIRSQRDRSPRRERVRSPLAINWHPNSGRDRSPRIWSRTPPRRDRTPPKDNWRIRSPRRRTPPRRFSPRRDDERRVRSPPRRDERRNSRSPFENRSCIRARSPIRTVSTPIGPRGFRARSRSPDRREIPKGPNMSRRCRSPTPAKNIVKPALPPTETSRRSSPPIQPEKSNYNHSQSQQRSPLPKTSRHKEKDLSDKLTRERPPARPIVPRSPPRGPASLRAPTGPNGSRNLTPHKSAASANSNGTTATFRPKSENYGSAAPPVGPRGYIPRGGSNIKSGKVSSGSDRVSKPDTSSKGAAPSTRIVPKTDLARTPTEPHKIKNPPNLHTPQTPSPSLPKTSFSSSAPIGPSSGVPTGPRAGVSSRQNLSYQQTSSAYNRSGKIASSSSNNSRPQITLSNTVSIIPSGRLDPTATGMSQDVAMRLKRKEEEEEILRAELRSKEEKLRLSLKHWDKLSRDSRAMGLRSESSEQHVRTLAGEGVGGSAF
ncbi:hypothetical protein Golomagni_01592 [Golovinomyces magnicellulatus]|nr:hypothetical protein Golomagni_01592 [Golovinomyces magnicellulatus]